MREVVRQIIPVVGFLFLLGVERAVGLPVLSLVLLILFLGPRSPLGWSVSWIIGSTVIALVYTLPLSFCFAATAALFFITTAEIKTPLRSSWRLLLGVAAVTLCFSWWLHFSLSFSFWLIYLAQILCAYFFTRVATTRHLNL